MVLDNYLIAEIDEPLVGRRDWSDVQTADGGPFGVTMAVGGLPRPRVGEVLRQWKILRRKNLRQTPGVA